MTGAGTLVNQKSMLSYLIVTNSTRVSGTSSEALIHHSQVVGLNDVVIDNTNV